MWFGFYWTFLWGNFRDKSGPPRQNSAKHQQVEVLPKEATRLDNLRPIYFYLACQGAGEYNLLVNWVEDLIAQAEQYTALDKGPEVSTMPFF